METTGTFEYAKKDFPHGKHVLSARAPCSECHSSDEKQHGNTAKTTADCNACHHKKTEDECKSCHALQAAVHFRKATPDHHAQATKNGKKVTCESCHEGVSPGHSRQNLRQLCAKYHNGQKTFARMVDQWQEGMREEVGSLERLQRKGRALLQAEIKLSERAEETVREALATSQKAIDLVGRDGSFGAHNLEYLDSVVSDAAEGLAEAMRAATR